MGLSLEGFSLEENYYDILNLPKEAANRDIRIAYIIKIRQFPNESFPEKFKEIRKAYETLSNPKSRKEYDAMSLYGEEIKQLQASASYAIEQEDYEESIRCYKKILIIEPSLLNIRNQYALALIYAGSYEKAITVLEKLVEKEEENAVYFFNLGFAHENKGSLEQAIQYYVQASELDPHDVNIIFSLSDVYLYQKDYLNARNAINNALARNYNEGFHQFMYLFKLLKIDVSSKSPQGIHETLSRIEQLLNQHPDEKKYVANEFGKFALELVSYKQFEWAYYVTEKGIELDPSHEELRVLHEEIKNKKELYSEFELFENDEKIIKPIRYNLFLYLFGNEFSEEEFKEHLEEMYKGVEHSSKYEPEVTVNSLKRMCIKYPSLYAEREDVLNEVLNISEEYKAINQQYVKMKKDSLITNSLKRLVALYLSETEEEERGHYFEDIMEEMSYEPPKLVVNSINRLQSEYPNLFNLNSSFLLKIKKVT